MNETIVALSTPPGSGAIGIIRLSGNDAISIISKMFKGADLEYASGYTMHFGQIVDNAGLTIDEVIVSLYRAPKSYTGEDVVEISCHGSDYILQRVIEVCILHGAASAQPGEFTRRAFLNGKLDLTQSEAVADLIASSSEAAHKAAMHQLKGGFSNDLKAMREELIHFSALIELELDFSQEDVEFADRTQLESLIKRLQRTATRLIESFRLGNAVKNGISVAIIGRPNAGKSTLLNALLNDERAIVSEIAGTTRDTIEEVINLQGLLYRFIDTAGIRSHTQDVIEQKGIERSLQKAGSADIVIQLLDGSVGIGEQMSSPAVSGQLITVVNKADTLTESGKKAFVLAYPHVLFIAAKDGTGIDSLKDHLRGLIMSGEQIFEATIITNSRHHAALIRIREAVDQIEQGLSDGLSGDLLSHHIRQALHYIGELTGQVQVDRDVLGAIFGKFCIGK